MTVRDALQRLHDCDEDGWPRESSRGGLKGIVLDYRALCAAQCVQKHGGSMSSHSMSLFMHARQGGRKVSRFSKMALKTAAVMRSICLSKDQPDIKKRGKQEGCSGQFRREKTFRPIDLVVNRVHPAHWRAVELTLSSSSRRPSHQERGRTCTTQW